MSGEIVVLARAYACAKPQSERASEADRSPPRARGKERDHKQGLCVAHMQLAAQLPVATAFDIYPLVCGVAE